ncbi:predicted protein [Naegleria gruberi]|uniref:Predicted protein n=1 Tax=Naegleria gruberi TaxID=5762 RepID=D2V2R4_NAEGR|nr:uncharacterized protein NAEGRDRAFT_63090 [Naegleria gruberi]EFC49107.1 predicted protein [Naegleria gruberi]|eukprot:XP_002681851.1 predicted protein [Naegleria gruberi strain NEG-M]
MFRDAKKEAIFVNDISNNIGPDVLAFDVHLFNMFMDIYLRLRATEQIWEMERFMEKNGINPNLTTLIFLTDASRVDNQVDKAIQYYRKAITQWNDCIELDTSYWNHFLSALALIGTDNMSRDATNSMTTPLQENELLSKYFSIMIDSGYEPDEDTFRFVIHGSRNINVMMETLDLMENEYGLFYLKCYDSISLFLSGSYYNPQAAKALFHRLLLNRGKFKDYRSSSAFFLDNSSAKVVGSLDNVAPTENALEFKHGLNLELTSIYQHLIRSFIPPNYTYEVDIDTMLTIYDYAVTKEKLKPTSMMMEDLIDAYCRVGNMKEAWVILSRMRSLNLFKINNIKIHWKLLMAYRHQQDVKGASTVMKDALEKRLAITEGLIKLYFESCRTSDEMTPLVVFCALIDRKFVDITQQKYLIPMVRDVFQNVKKKFGVVHKQQINDIDSEEYGEFAKFQKITSMLHERYVKFH